MKHSDMPTTSSRRLPTGASDQIEARETRPFLGIVTVVLVALTVLSFSSDPELRTMPAAALFIGLMLAHGALYWLLLRLPAMQAWHVGYLVVQTALAAAIALLAGNVAVDFGLFAALIGLAVGMLRNRIAAVIAVIILLALSLLIGLQTTEGMSLPWWLFSVVPMTAFVVVYVVLYTRQAEAKAEAQRLLRELETAHRQLAEYAVQVEDLTLAAERQRMARELHDTLAQGLAGLILQLEAAKSQLEAGRTTRTGEIIDQALLRARETLGEARQAIGDLRSSDGVPADLGLAIRREVDRFSAATGIPCAVEVSLSATLPQRSTEHAVRIVSEALSNVALHAEADHVWVSAAQQDDLITITVRDDGVGFDSDPQKPGAGHYGLVGMRERARLAGGMLAVTSAPGRGTAVQLSLPASHDGEASGDGQH
ncbi:MAG: sensor histidine kinase [Anaerolineae bacterium]|nr:sensor histidine kinase [Anaerolineae bacterium]